VRALRIAAGLIAAFAIVYAAVPFSAEPPDHFALGASQAPRHVLIPAGALVAVSSVGSEMRCGPAAIDAWHAKSPPTGWFAYAPLTSTPAMGGGTCRAPSQDRLQVSFVGLLLAFGLVLVARWIGRPRGFGTDPAPNPAT
jgi:hypothetical protein